MSLTAALLMAPMLAQCPPTGPKIQGYTHGSLYCHGEFVSISAAISSFRPNKQFRYRFHLYLNGSYIFGDVSAIFRTTSSGSHNSMPARYIECLPGEYRLDIWAEAEDQTYHTGIDTKIIWCG